MIASLKYLKCQLTNKNNINNYNQHAFDNAVSNLNKRKFICN